jgi:formamidopyrimidine-DNA glycosylase
VPELPEVETIVLDLAPRITGRHITHPRLHRSDGLRGVRAARLLQTLDGSRIERIARRAKHVVLRLSGGHRLVIQPRMTGSLVVHRRALTRAERRYAVLELPFREGGRLVYRDVRRLGTIWLLDEAGWGAYTGRIGPEPLDRTFDARALGERLRGTRQAIKKVLMDQRRLAGVGNIYVNEALFMAGIDPSRPADTLSRAEIGMVHRSVRRVLRAAIANRGTTVRDYRTGTGQRGAHQTALHVYGRAGAPCDRCGTPLVTTHAIDGRATTFCWRCQR